MTGILRMESFREEKNLFTHSAPLDDISLRLESIFKDLDKVINLYESLSIGNLNSTELSLASYQLDNIKSVSAPSVRFEHHQTEQQRLKLRCEGFFDSIWEAISKFFKWVGDTVSGWFSDDDKSESSSSADVSKAEEEIKNISNTIENKSPQEISNLAGLEKILNLDSEGEMRQYISFYISSFQGFPLIAEFLVGEAKKLLSTDGKDFKKSEFLKNFIEQASKNSNANVKSKFANGKKGSYSAHVVEKNLVFVMYLEGENLKVEKVKMKESTSEKVKLSVNEVENILLTAVRGIEPYNKLRLSFKDKIRPSMNELEGKTKALKSKNKPKNEEKALAENVKAVTETLKILLDGSLKLIKVGKSFKVVSTQYTKAFSSFDYKNPKNNKTNNNNSNSNSSSTVTTI